MKRQLILIGIFVLLIAIGLSGCVTENDQNNSEEETLLFVITDTGSTRNPETQELTQVFVEIQNIDTEGGLFTVDFTFTTVDLDETGPGDYGGGTTGGDSSGINYYETQKQEYISPHESEKIYCDTTPQPGNIITSSWDYEVTSPSKTQ